MRILGIDPGSRVTGYGVIDSDGRSSRHVASGCIRLGAGELPPRLGRIFTEVGDLVAEYAPQALAVEKVFMAKNAASALVLGHARGAAMTACVQAGLEVFEYAPRAVKLAVVGSGAADKAQVQHMMRMLLGLTRAPAADAADALAVALCHAHTHSTRSAVSRVAR
ncbi:crossover junction endodeoxyribonuclease RuvC [Acidihalobacter ferrooxydans]|uniref:Crossover junction endodeoxyribonuclease RuvC n=1 Tax=Acidihalobacter ferrooxydans TaxID=1765967 RepID=A0A1P8UHR3_9GAMM|nr:crossover junction endodeoxyribonuclease RuvC [Acidihalobacter ferrooxydans]APZ43386.1 crossover junction endodeoxyribonuclease RuvC [Acidihalobacter ferrooxydans]